MTPEVWGPKESIRSSGVTPSRQESPSPAGLWDQGAISNQNPQLLVPTAAGNGLARGHSRAAAPRDVSLLGLLPPGTSASQPLPSGAACCGRRGGRGAGLSALGVPGDSAAG